MSPLLPQVFALPQDTREELDTTVQALHEVCIQAMHDATDMHPRNQGLKHAPWWNDACAEHIDLIRSLTGPEKKEVQKRTRAVFRQAKREHYTTVCEAATPDTIWKMAKWGTRTRTTPIPPLKDGDRLAMTLEERASTFHRVFFPQPPTLPPI